MLKQKITHLILATAAAFCLCACSDSPADLVEKDFELRKFFTGADLKAKVLADAEAERKAAYDYFLAEENDEEIAKEEGAAAADAILDRYEGWTDSDYQKSADRMRRWLAGAVLTIESETVTGDTAVVVYNIKLRNGLKQECKAEFKKESGKWRLLPAKDLLENEDGEDDPAE